MTATLYGVMAEFTSPDALLAAARRARSAGHTNVEAYSPFSVDGLPEAIGAPRDWLPTLAFIGGLLGGAGAWFLQWYTATIDYPINAGGRPLDAWPAFIPAVFEMAVLGAALCAFLGFLVLNGLPAFYHPVFNAPDFDLATRNRFFLCLRAADPRFDEAKARDLLQRLEPLRVFDVER